MVPIVDATPAQSSGSSSPVVYQGVDESDTYIYTVRPGDTLGTISQQYLGASSRYTELLKLNKLAPNDSIFVGQKLKLPTKGLTIPKESSYSKHSKSRQTVSTTASKESYPELEALIEAEEYNQAIQWTLNHEKLETSQSLQQKLVVAAKGQSEQYKRQQNTAEAEALLSGLISETPLSSANKAMLEAELSTLRAEQQLLTAKQYADRSQFDDSYELLLNAWNNVGKPLEENILFTTTRNKVSENYHQQALRLYRNQKLDDALEFWQKILAINPNDDLALVYQDRVKALQNKLDNL
ncbi:hypothetical protein GCM10009123_09150 [Kangiella japonica]|uniref:LysM domain-containing protein n=1 Tax=Kangiella japonica TaxID=647384 RepID=A0ABN0SX13_9GAMM